jgi:hypothetical protein
MVETQFGGLRLEAMYRPGVKNQAADAMSRLLSLQSRRLLLKIGMTWNQ